MDGAPQSKGFGEGREEQIPYGNDNQKNRQQQLQRQLQLQPQVLRLALRAALRMTHFLAGWLSGGFFGEGAAAWGALAYFYEGFDADEAAVDAGDHASLNQKPPISRAGLDDNNLLRHHT